MTVKEFANSYGISAQAVYQKVKDRGIELGQLKDKDGKNLSADGLNILASLFTNEVKKVDEADKEIKARMQHLEEENAILKAELEKSKALLQMKDEMVDMLKNQLDYMQRLQALTLQRIPDHRPTLWQRLTGRTGKSTEENTVK